MAERLLTVTEAAKTIGVSPSSLRRWTDEGRLVAIRLPGGGRRYERAELERFLQGLRTDADGAREG